MKEDLPTGSVLVIQADIVVASWDELLPGLAVVKFPNPCHDPNPDAVLGRWLRWFHRDGERDKDGFISWCHCGF